MLFAGLLLPGYHVGEGGRLGGGGEPRHVGVLVSRRYLRKKECLGRWRASIDDVKAAAVRVCGSKLL